MPRFLLYADNFRARLLAVHRIGTLVAVKEHSTAMPETITELVGKYGLAEMCRLVAAGHGRQPRVRTTEVHDAQVPEIVKKWRVRAERADCQFVGEVTT